MRYLPEDAPVILYLPKPWIKTPYKACVQLPALLPSPPSLHVSPPPRGVCPWWGQKEVSTQHARCWIGCYFSRPTGPTQPRVGVGASGDRTCRAGERGQNFPVLSICNLVTNREKWVSEG